MVKEVIKFPSSEDLPNPYEDSDFRDERLNEFLRDVQDMPRPIIEAGKIPTQEELKKTIEEKKKSKTA